MPLLYQIVTLIEHNSQQCWRLYALTTVVVTNRLISFECLTVSDLFPINENGFEQTKEFLVKVIDICLDFIRQSNDRSSKVLDFHQPDQMKQLFDFSIPEKPLDIETVVNDCRQALKYQVKTGKSRSHSLNRCSLSFLEKPW